MYNKNMGSYDEIPDGMKYYINNYGCHFNRKLCQKAVSRMYRDEEDDIKPYTKLKKGLSLIDSTLTLCL